jgi:hypothetical protein
MEHICPITLEPIKVYGITCYGSIYEYDAIKKWLESNNIDPGTNLPLPTKALSKVDKSEYQEKNREQVKKNTLLWCYQYKLIVDSIKKYNDIILIKNSIDLKSFEKYNQMKRDQFINLEDNFYYSTLVCQGNVDSQDTISRPCGTGQGLQFIDLSNLVIQNKNFKGCDFSFANLENTKFIQCNLSRTNFISSNLKNCKFLMCEFIGEETSFYKANVDSCIFFLCSMEYVEKWQRETNWSKQKEILKKRLYDVDDPYSVLL